MSGPDVTVLVVAHHRQTYLELAVRSAAQALSKAGGGELLVVKAFENPELDRRLEALGARCLLERSEPVGSKIARGVRESQGELLSILEDDDLFEPEKVAGVRELFDADPTLGYVQHNISIVDARGTPLPARTYRDDVTARLERLGQWTVRPSDRPRLLPQLPLDPYFSASAIVVRRGVLTPHLETLTRVNFVPDAFLFFAALAGPWSVMLDHHPWTRFRFHPANTSVADGRAGPDFLARMARWSGGLLPALRLVEEMVERHAGPIEIEQVHGVIACQEVYAVLRTVERGRSDMRSALARFSSHRGAYSWRTHARVRHLARLFVLSPGLARALYIREKSRASEPR